MRISIIIPAYNAENTLERAVESCALNDAGESEILVIDNNSTDGTSKVIAKIRNDQQALIRSYEEKTQGASAARNKGLKKAKGEWIQFLDADDTLAPNKISHQLEQITPETHWVIGGYRILSPGKEDIDVVPHEDPWKGLVYKYRIGCTHANLYRKSALNLVGEWDESLPDNTDPNLHFELLKSGLKYQIVPEVLSYYHQHDSPDRLSTKAPIAGNLRRIDLLERINDYLRLQRPEYWQANRDFFLAAVLRALRILATHDLTAATPLVSRLIREKKLTFELPNQPLISQKLLFAYRLGGFPMVEKIRLSATGFLPVRFKEWLKH